MKKLREMPMERHPFNLERFELILAELDEAANGFYDLHYLGRNRAARDLARQASAAKSAIYRLWEAMRAVEEAERSAA